MSVLMAFKAVIGTWLTFGPVHAGDPAVRYWLTGGFSSFNGMPASGGQQDPSGATYPSMCARGEASVVVPRGSVLHRSEGCFGRRRSPASSNCCGLRHTDQAIHTGRRQPLLESLNRTLGLIYRFFQSGLLGRWVQTT